MAGLINLKLLTDFFNKIGQTARFQGLTNTVTESRRDRTNKIRHHVLQGDASVMRGRELLCVLLGSFVRKVADAVRDSRDINEWRIGPLGANHSVRRLNRGYI